MPKNSINITKHLQDVERCRAQAVRLNIMGRFISAAILVLMIFAVLAVVVR